MEVETAPQLPQPQVAPAPNHHSPYSPPHSSTAKPTLPLPTSHSPREPPLHPPSLSNSRRASAAGIKEANHAAVQSPHHIVPVTNGLHPPNGQYYSQQSETIMDNLSRVQTVTSLNQASLEAQHRKLDGQGKDIERLEGMVGRLQQEMRGVQEVLETIRSELRHRPDSGAGTSSASDETLELFAKNLTNMSAKVQEVEGVKMQVEIMKRKLSRLEEGGPSAPHSGVAYSSPRDGTMLTSTSVHSAGTVPKINTPIRPEVRSLTGGPYHHTPTEITPHNLEHEQQSSAGGWVSVNSSAKRGYTNGVEGRTDSAFYTLGSPKRPKLAPMEPQVNMDPKAHISYDRMDTDEEYSRGHSRESFSETGVTPSSYAQYSTQPANPDDNWRSDQRAQEQRSPKRGRGGGGARVGRPRKSLPPDYELSTPEWEKPEWAGSQGGGGQDGYYQPVTPGGSKRGALVRRGSGGGGSASARSITMENEMPRQQHDPYAHTKKTRTKPTRNSEGVLIRKDGRPDMRSHSSAANLRKVHARKEQERAMEQGLTPQGTAAPTSNASGDTPSPNESGNTEASTQDRHASIIKQIFPHGVDESRERMSYASKLFPAVNSPTHPPGDVNAEGHRPHGDGATPENEQEHEHATAMRGTSAASEDRSVEKRPSVPPSASPESNPEAHKS